MHNYYVVEMKQLRIDCFFDGSPRWTKIKFGDSILSLDEQQVRFAYDSLGRIIEMQDRKDLERK